MRTVYHGSLILRSFRAKTKLIEEKASEKAQGAETKVNINVSKVIKREFNSRFMGLWREIILRTDCRLSVS